LTIGSVHEYLLALVVASRLHLSLSGMVSSTIVSGLNVGLSTVHNITSFEVLGLRILLVFSHTLDVEGLAVVLLFFGVEHGFLAVIALG